MADANFQVFHSLLSLAASKTSDDNEKWNKMNLHFHVIIKELLRGVLIEIF
jgi:hypothetical protein